MSFLSQMGSFFSDVGTTLIGSDGDDERAKEIRKMDTAEDNYNKQVDLYRQNFGHEPSAEQQANFRKKASGQEQFADAAARDEAALKAQEATDPLFTMTGGQVAPKSVAAGSIGPGGTSFSSQGPSPLLLEQMGVGFVAVDPMAFLKTFR